MGRAAYVRLYSGRLKNRDMAPCRVHKENEYGETEALEERKITQIRAISASGKGDDVGEMQAGDICMVYGLGDIKIGHVLGNAKHLPRRVEPGHLRTPLMTVQAIPEKPEDMQALRAACEILSGEDPLLEAHYVRSLNELHLHVMGAIQLEILQELLLTRFNLAAHFTKPAVIYRETLAKPTFGFVAYTMPKPCWAIIRLRIDPLPRGSGIQFESKVSPRDIALRYQHQVENALPLALRQGMMGWQVTDVKVTLIDGNHHEIHTHPLDFVVATPMAMMDGLRRGGTKLLEPMLSCQIWAPEGCVGRIMSDIVKMRGQLVKTSHTGDMARLTALLPAATSLSYPEELLQLTSGRGGMNVKLMGYQDAPADVQAEMPRRGVNPLDTAKYILAARSALEGEIFDR